MDIAALKQAAQAATPGPWKDCDPTEALHAIRAVNGRIIADVGYSGTVEQDKANATYITAANPAAVLALIESHELLAADSDALRKDAARYRYLRDYSGSGTCLRMMLNDINFNPDSEIDATLAAAGAA